MDNFLVPVYLGKSSVAKSGKNKGSLDSYYFYASKSGVGRFVKHSNYPYWAAASNVPDSLVLEDPPESVVNEVQAFVSGKLEFTIVPKTRGRSEVVLRKEVSYNQENGVCKNVASNQPVAAQRPDTSKSDNPGKAHPPSPETTRSQRPSNVLPPSPQGSGSNGEQGTKSLHQTGPDAGPGNLRRLPDLGPGGGFPSGFPRSILPEFKLSPTPDGKSRARRMPGTRVLGDSGSSQRSVDERTTVDEVLPGSFDGSVKKRFRRTKEQLASGVSLESLKAHKEGLS